MELDAAGSWTFFYLSILFFPSLSLLLCVWGLVCFRFLFRFVSFRFVSEVGFGFGFGVEFAVMCVSDEREMGKVKGREVQRREERKLC